MQSRRLTLALVYLIFFIWGINTIADQTHLYYLLWWFDIPMHIMGGLWVALMSLVIYYHTSYFKRKDRSVAFVISFALASTMIIGLFWEVFEFSVEHFVKLNDNGLLDTLKDLVDDLIGASLATAIFIKRGYNKSI